MSPEEKAKELVLRFAFKGAQHEGEAKTFALILCNELIAHSRNTAMVYDLSFDESENYWTKVKNEIQLL
jgi:hypothetical protein